MTYPYDLNQLAQLIKAWGRELSFQQVEICDTDLSHEEPRLQAWLDKQYHGEMAWMARHGMLRVISVRMNYLPAKAAFANTLNNPTLGYVSRYALGRNYHKLLRQRLKKLGDRIQEHCGRCVACMTTCPTGAIVAPYTVDARRCTSYLTIELEGAIPEALRPLMGNRIYGCDDCQLICPWNRFSQLTDEDDFSPRAALHTPALLDLFGWDEAKFLRSTEGSAIRRIGHQRWLRNIALALGNAPYEENVVLALRARLGQSALIDEHIH